MQLATIDGAICDDGSESFPAREVSSGAEKRLSRLLVIGEGGHGRQSGGSVVMVMDSASGGETDVLDV